MDLVQGYHQAPVRLEEAKDGGHYPLQAAHALWPQKCSTGIPAPDGFSAEGPHVPSVYLDDILVASDRKEEHLSHLRILFDRLSQHGLNVNPVKCQFGLLSIDFLGHHITKDGAIPLPLKPLLGTLKGKAPSHAIDWSADMAKAFVDTKQALANTTMLAHPLPGAQISLTTDASDYVVGAVHEQLVGGALQRTEIQYV
ncbi:hypothetical protein AAFF_G00007380 [Aldrovandia affinis]|uniref:ribonuclease H n=1 Tax=Aldrovandia affinis TaxID=143900 RepID=A0AAD7T644_9TELE|nr:hypothetical protein AAFF_G00007380 [Aldrovandia affinis]